jgi:hypothetical protein
MKFAVCAVDPPAFEAWMTEQSRRPQPVVSGVPVDPDSTSPAPGSPTCPSKVEAPS